MEGWILVLEGSARRELWLRIAHITGIGRLENRAILYGAGEHSDLTHHHFEDVVQAIGWAEDGKCIRCGQAHSSPCECDQSEAPYDVPLRVVFAPDPDPEPDRPNIKDLFR